MKKADALKLQNRREYFREATGTKKTLINTVITPYGLIANEYASDAVDVEIVEDEVVR